ncbi:MAG TPA: glycosyl hydrolase, partial [Vicinamibacteria bacterium]
RHLPALFAEDTPDRNARVLVDYRTTISDLLLETFTREWQAFATRRGAKTRNQAHGSPANILDLYAATDIPETEGNEIMRMKWATSAAHVGGRRLASAEAATWLGEHFRSTLADVRRAVDLFFLAGVNHIVYHGTAYSPPSEPWPGWLFYAAVHFNPRNSWWTDFGTLNQYVTRVQSFLQRGVPDNDVLLYFPFHEAIAVRGPGLLEHFGDARLALPGTPFDQAAQTLQRRGYGFDFVSDRQLLAVQTTGGKLTTGGTSYQTVVVPGSTHLPVPTLERLLALARAGGTVIAFHPLADDVPGLGDLEPRRAALRRALGEIRFTAPGADGVREARVGAGVFLQGDTLEPLLARARVPREPMVDAGLQFTRRRLGDDRVYFVAHAGTAPVDGWMPLAAEGQSVALFDPMDGSRGYASSRKGKDGGLEVYLQLHPGESTLLVAKTAPAGPDTYRHWRAAEPGRAIEGDFAVRFEEGGPERPGDVRTATLASWTAFGGEAVKSFSGTARYSVSFPRPKARAAAFALDLGAVHDSARVRLNGKDLATLIGPRFRVVIEGSRLAETNVLEIAVSNLMANHIAFLDLKKVRWKKFYNVNFPARLPANRGSDGLFHADHWAPLPSGLLGPVTLTPLTAVVSPEVPPVN